MGAGFAAFAILGAIAGSLIAALLGQPPLLWGAISGMLAPFLVVSIKLLTHYAGPRPMRRIPRQAGGLSG